MRVRIAQCLCPSRHTILGMIIHDPTLSDAQVVQALKELVAAVLRGDPIPGLPAELLKTASHCGICGVDAKEWLYEVGWSKEFTDFESAKDAIDELQRRQRESRQLLDAIGLSYDSYRKREMN